MDTVLYLASLATRPTLPTRWRVWQMIQHLFAAFMVLVSFLLLLHAICGD